MERLTMKINDKAKCAYESTEECFYIHECYKCKRYHEMVKELFAYEDTGFTANEINKMLGGGSKAAGFPLSDFLQDREEDNCGTV